MVFMGGTEMVYLALQMLFWILLAIAFGLFIGWLIWKRSSRANHIELDDLHQTLLDRENKIARLRDNIAQCKAILKVYKEEMDAKMNEIA
jgi:hypothetical protein